ncbi:MAG: NADase-type glycan-binding domain-containing protein [Pseudonocardiaceae bacterium]
MTYCTTCGTPQESGTPFCTGCGKQMSTAPSAATGTAWPTRSHPRGRLVAAVTTLVLLLGGGGVAAWAALTHAGGPPEPPGPLPNQPHSATSSPARNDPSRSGSAPLWGASVSASCVLPSSQDAGGTIVGYEPENAIDGLPDTAWRCGGNGIGQRLEISFPSTVTLTSVGMVPGYAKTDPYDGTDRYAQNRRISAVRYMFDDGSAVTQNFDTSASHRSLQTLALPNVSTSHVTITILNSVSGEATGGSQPFDRVAISEVAISVR